MNIRDITRIQQGTRFDSFHQKWDGFNCFKEYAVFCTRRRTYQIGRKGLTHSNRNIGRSKYNGKGRVI